MLAISSGLRIAGAAIVWLLASSAGACTADAGGGMVLVREGVAQVPLVAGSQAEPVAELRRYLEISGAELAAAPPGTAGPGIYVGLAGDFPQLQFRDLGCAAGARRVSHLQPRRRLCLVANTPGGVQHAVTTFLHSLGCRSLFPGKTWE